MSQPTPYTRKYSATSHSTNYPTTPQPGVSMDAEWNAVKATLDDILTNLALIQRDDGALANQSVTKDSLAAGLLAMLVATGVPRGEWATATAYAAQDLVDKDGITYIAVAAHTSGTFSTDLAADQWLAITGASPADDTIVDAMVRSSAAIASEKLSFLRTETGAAALSARTKLGLRWDVLDFEVNADGGGIGTGTGTDDAANFQAAIDAISAAGGGELVINGGRNYLLLSQIEGASNVTITIESGAEIDYTGASDGGVAAGRPGDFWIFGGGTMGDGIAVSGSLAAKATTINTSSAHGFTSADVGKPILVQSDQNTQVRDWATSTAYAVGDVVEESSTIYVCDEAHTSGTFATDLSASKWSSTTGAAQSQVLGTGTAGISKSLFGELVEIEAVPTTTSITVRNGLTYAYASGANPKVYLITPIENFHVRGPGKIGGNGVSGIGFHNARNCSVKGVHFLNTSTTATVTIRMSIFCDVMWNFNDSADLAAAQVGIAVSHGSANCRVLYNKGRNGSHLVDVTTGDLADEDSDTGRISGPARNILIGFNEAWNCQTYAFGSHDGCDGVSFIGNTAHNCDRGIVSRSRNALIVGNRLANGVTTDPGIFISQWSINTTVSGNHITGYTTAIQVDGGDTADGFHPFLNVAVDGNFIRGCTSRGILVDGVGSAANDDIGLDIVNNRMSGMTGAYGIQLLEYCNGARISGNRIIGPCTTSGIQIGDNCTDFLVENNVLTDLGAGIEPVDVDGTSSGTIGYNHLIGTNGTDNIASGASVARVGVVTRKVVLADDAFTTITADTTYGLIQFASESAEVWGFAHYDVGASADANGSVGSNVALGIGALTTGTSDGTDTKLNVHAHTDGKIYIKNRIGGSVTLQYTLAAGFNI